MKILIVDDSIAMRRLIQRTLRQAGFDGIDFIEAHDGIEGLELARQEAPCLILSDWKIPALHGYDLLCALREEGYEAPFGFVTCDGRPGVFRKALGAGADFLLKKPITPEVVAATLKPYLG